jgi:hypothetical protein
MVGGMAGGLSNVANKIVGAISPVGPGKDAYAAKVRPQQIKMLADKSLNAWRAYEKELLKSNPGARESGMYEQALMAFVSKNLLGGQYLPNVINQAEIKVLVKQLSEPGSVTEAVPTVKPITKPVGSLASRSAQRNAPATAATTPTTPATATTPTTPATATNPAAATTAPDATPSAPMSPQKQQDLWLQLVQQAVIAQTQAPGTQKPSDKQPDPGTDTTAGDARSYQQQFNKDMDAAVVRGLPLFGNTAVKNIGNNNVQSTGNPVADALLLMAGFRGI